TSSTTATFSGLGFSMGTSSHLFLVGSGAGAPECEMGVRSQRTPMKQTRSDCVDSSASSGGPGGPFSTVRCTGGLRRTAGRTGATVAGGPRRLLDGGLGLEAVAVDLDAAAHGGADRDLLAVAALGRSRLGSLELVEDGPEVLLERLGSEAHLAERHVDV